MESNKRHNTQNNTQWTTEELRNLTYLKISFLSEEEAAHVMKLYQKTKECNTKNCPN